MVEQVPHTGQVIYVDTSLDILGPGPSYLGGVATITKAHRTPEPVPYSTYVEVKEQPGRWLNWEYVLYCQDMWTREFRNKRAGKAYAMGMPRNEVS